MENIGKIITLVGIFLVIAGLIIWFFGNKFGWFGNLPGDINIEGQRFNFYAPIMSMLLISILISLILWIISKFFK